MDIDVNAQSRGITREKFKGIDVCVDFTTPDAVLENVTVCGAGSESGGRTTGWQKHQAEVRKVIEQAGVGMVLRRKFFHRRELVLPVGARGGGNLCSLPMYILSSPSLTIR